MIINQIILITAIILVSTLAGFLLEKSGTMAIGIESILTVSAFSFVFFYHQFGETYISIIFSSIIALCIGSTINIIMQIFITLFKSNQALILLGLNITIPMLLFLISTQNSPYPNGYKIPAPIMIGEYNLLFIIFIIISFIIILIFIVLIFKTKFGLILNAIGENPHVIQTSGRNIYFEKIKIAFLSGIIASISGIFLIFFKLVLSGVYYNGSLGACGMGYISIGIVILCKWKFNNYLWITPAMSLLIGLFYNFVNIYNDNVSLLYLLKGIPYILPMIMLPFISKTQKSPAQLGVTFNKNKRN